LSDDRAISYTEGDRQIYRASGAGSCLTALVAAGLGYEETPGEFQAKTLNTAAAEGNLHEGAIVDWLIDEGWRIETRQQEVEVQVIPGVFIRGHTDGMGKPPRKQKNRLIEIKTMSSDRFKRWKASGSDVRARLVTDEWYRYGVQISAYMHALDYPVTMYVVKDRNSGAMDIQEMTLPPVEWREIKKRIIKAEMWRKKGELPPCEAASGTRFFCPFPYLHNGEEFGAEPEEDEPVVDSATATAVAAFAERYDDLRGQVSRLKPLDNERKEVGRNLVAAMGGEHGPKSMIAGRWKVTRVEVTNERVDARSVAEELGMSYEDYQALLERNKKPSPYSYPKVVSLDE